MFIRQSNDGNWYVCRTTNSSKKPSKARGTLRNWFLVKHTGSGGAYVTYCAKGYLCCPTGFLGKRVRLRVEVI